jgi:antitoxin HicB
MREAGVSNGELARRLGWQDPQIDRLLDLNHASRLDQIETALAALGKRLDVRMSDAASAA